jgi:hypothetical protein
MIISNQIGFLEPIPLEICHNKEQLKGEFVACLADISRPSGTLREVIVRLAGLGVERKEFVRWAVEAGYRKGYARTLLSKVLCDAGLRQRRRRRGAEMETPQEVLILIAFAREKFGARAGKLLRQAARAVEAEDLRQHQNLSILAPGAL